MQKKSLQLQVKHLGLIEYESALSQMLKWHQAVVLQKEQPMLLVCQHFPVITCGRRLHGTAVALSPDLITKGVKIVETDRGGLLTYHGPGQIVIYFILPVLDYFKGPADMVLGIENILLNFCRQLGLMASLKPEAPGVWVGAKKIASIGIRIESGVSRHGLALNVNCDLSVYSHFDPCGFSGQVMSTLSQLLARPIGVEEYADFENQLTKLFCQI